MNPQPFVNPMPRLLGLAAVYLIGAAVTGLLIPNRTTRRWFWGTSFGLFVLAAGFALYAIMSLQGLR